MDGLIVKKEGGARIYNSTLDLKSIKEYFLDPVAGYEQAKDHTLAGADREDDARVL